MRPRRSQRLLRELGAGADANSGGEIEVALRAGFAPGDVVFTGVGKTRDDLTRAISLGVAAINAESPGEVDRIAEIAAALRTTARIAVRVNPDVEAGSHPHISTGHRATKFGMSPADAAALMRDVAARGSLKPVGLHVHVGSQITRTEPLAQGARVIARSGARPGGRRHCHRASGHRRRPRHRVRAGRARGGRRGLCSRHPAARSSPAG